MIDKNSYEAFKRLRNAIGDTFGESVSLVGLGRKSAKLTVRLLVNNEEKAVIINIRDLLASDGVREEILRRVSESLSETNVKEHAPLSARASVDHGVDVGITEEHVNRAADRGCCVSACSASSY